MNTSDCIKESCLVHKDQAMFGWRDKSGKFIWPISYSRFWGMAQRLAYDLLLKIPPNVKLIPMDKAVPGVAIASVQNRWEWIAADVACGIAGLLAVGIHTHWPVDDVKQVLENTGVVIVVTDKESKPVFEETGLNHLIYLDMDEIGKGEFTYQINSDDEIAEKIAEQKNNIKLNDNPYHTVIFSSGTSGAPKGVGVRKEKWIADASNGFKQIKTPPGAVLSLVSHASFAHAMDRGVTWQGAVFGARIGFARNDTEEKFYADLADIQPFLFPAMSSIWNRLYSTYLQLVTDNLQVLMETSLREGPDGAEGGLFKMLLTMVLHSDRLSQKEKLRKEKETAVAAAGSAQKEQSSNYYTSFSSSSSSSSASSNNTFLLSTPEADADAFEVIHRVQRLALSELAERFKYNPKGLGFRVLNASGSHIDDEVLLFVHRLFSNARIFVGYGCIEVISSIPGITLNGKINPKVDLRLDDVPELGYTNKDKPYPRGEVWARLPEMSTEYWGSAFRPEVKALTDAAFVMVEGEGEGKEGKLWYRTGDIGEIDWEEKILRIIDRRNQMGSLYYNGFEKFLPLDARESFYSSVLGRRVCLHADRTQTRAIAIVEMHKEKERVRSISLVSSPVQVVPSPVQGIISSGLAKQQRIEEDVVGSESESGSGNGGGSGSGDGDGIVKPVEALNAFHSYSQSTSSLSASPFILFPNPTPPPSPIPSSPSTPTLHYHQPNASVTLLSQMVNAARTHGEFTDTPGVPFDLNIPAAVVCSRHCWTEAAGLITPTGKLRRRALYKLHETEISAVYARLKKEEEEEVEVKK